MMCRCKLMKQIQTLSFIVHETVLYLDGHPNDRRAIAYYEMKNKELENAVAQYEDMFGPLTAYDVTGTERWTWIDGPWPWKYEANVEMN